MAARHRIETQSSRNGKFLVTTVRMFVPNLPTPFHGYRIVHLTDFHYGPATSIRHVNQVVEATNALEPDLIALTGDYIQLDLTNFRYFLATKVDPRRADWLNYKRRIRLLARELGDAFSNFKAKDGIIGVYGNHDYVEGPRIIERGLPKTITWLVNGSVKIRREDSLIRISGVDDLKRGKPNLAKALSFDEIEHEVSARNGNPYLGSPYGKDTGSLFRGEKDSRYLQQPFLNVLLAHNPDITIRPDSKLISKTDLVLCGHTHGGQIRVPFIGPIYTRTHQKKHVQGLAYHEDVPVYVSRGVGYGVIPLRVLCPPEIVVFTLLPEN